MSGVQYKIWRGTTPLAGPQKSAGWGNAPFSVLAGSLGCVGGIYPSPLLGRNPDERVENAWRQRIGIILGASASALRPKQDSLGPAVFGRIEVFRALVRIGSTRFQIVVRVEEFLNNLLLDAKNVPVVAGK